VHCFEYQKTHHSLSLSLSLTHTHTHTRALIKSVRNDATVIRGVQDVGPCVQSGPTAVLNDLLQQNCIRFYVVDMG